MILEVKLRTAAREYEQLMLDCLPEPDECEASFSPKFEWKMKKMIHRVDHPYRYWIQKSAACFLLAVLLCGGGLLTFNTEARAAFFGWVREITGGFFAYHYVGEEPDTFGDIVYRPTWIPDGYEVVEEDIDSINGHIVYRNADGDMVVFLYDTGNESARLRVDGENAIVQRAFVKDYPADLYLDQNPEGGNILIWEDTDRTVIFDIWAALSSEEIIKIAESIEGRPLE